MKRIIYLSALLVIVSCSVLKFNNNEYNGIWVLQSKSGGFSGRTTIAENEVKLVIKNSRIKYFENGKLIYDELFKVEKLKVIESTELQNVIVNDRFKKQSVIVKNDTLIITDQCYDCYTYIYKRK